MKRISFYCTFLFLLFFISTPAHAQVNVKIESGMIYINNGLLGRLDEKKYTTLTDSLDKNLKVKPNDTTSLFFRALLYLSFNDLKAKPFQGASGALENLVIAKDMAEKAVGLGMKNFNLKVLRAQLYKELTYRFTGDESWKYNSKQIADRRKQFNDYKDLANRYYDELAVLDKANAYEYQKLKVTGKYPL
jgi:hypothetical protein